MIQFDILSHIILGVNNEQPSIGRLNHFSNYMVHTRTHEISLEDSVDISEKIIVLEDILLPRFLEG